MKNQYRAILFVLIIFGSGVAAGLAAFAFFMVLGPALATQTILGVTVCWLGYLLYKTRLIELEERDQK